MTLGTVVIVGRTYQITGLRLLDGQLQVTAQGWGPSPAVTGEPVTIFGEDGLGVCQAWNIDIPALGSHQDATVILPIQITHIDTPSGPTRIIWR